MRGTKITTYLCYSLGRGPVRDLREERDRGFDGGPERLHHVQRPDHRGRRRPPPRRLQRRGRRDAQAHRKPRQTRYRTIPQVRISGSRVSSQNQCCFQLCANARMNLILRARLEGFSQVVQGSAKKWTPGCANGAGKFKQKWKARAATKFTKPGDQAEPCMKYGANLPFA